VPFPDRIAVIGGGRWARVLLESLSTLGPPGTNLFCCTSSNELGMREWIGQMGLAREISCIPFDQLLSLPQPIPVIVANAARDHEMVVEQLLDNAFPSLVEKPLAMSRNAAQRLVDKAAAQSAKLATAHVFTFARYVERFGALTHRCGDIRSIGVRWLDPGAEIRYGETKRYDTGLPIFCDVLPHVISIVNALVPRLNLKFRKLNLSNGGRVLEIELGAGHIDLRVALARESSRRERVIHITTNSGPISMDFSREPGTICLGAEKLNGDPDWGHRPGPLASMLSAYLDWAVGESDDQRLDPALAVDICHLIDMIRDPYLEQRTDWLVNSRGRPETARDADTHYALREFFAMEGMAEAPVLARKFSEDWWSRSRSERKAIIASARRPAPSSDSSPPDR
jgi:predicted dehydrogenase